MGASSRIRERKSVDKRIVVRRRVEVAGQIGKRKKTGGGAGVCRCVLKGERGDPRHFCSIGSIGSASSSSISSISASPFPSL